MIIKNGLVIDPASRTIRYLDIKVENGVICSMTPAGGLGECQQEPPDQTIDASGMVVAPGLVDVHVHFRDPGFTYKEDIESGARAAAAGGFTTVVCMANTKPVNDNSNTLSYILEKGKSTKIHVLAAAAISKGFQGRELTDMAALKEAGAVGFTDDGIPLMDERLVWEAMKEAVRLDMPLSFHEEHPAFILNHGIHQGCVAQELGIGGSPALAEDIMVARDCMLALHTGARVSIQHISSRNAVEVVRLAQKLGARVSAEITPHHFVLNEEAVRIHGALAKMNPPLRTEKDRKALLKALKDGVIEIIATDHAPHSREEKEKSLTQAPSGIIGLETSLALGITYLVKPGHLTLMELLEKMTVKPADFYHLDAGRMTTAGPADLVVFDPEEEWTADHFFSKSSNSPFAGERLFGKVKYTICSGEIAYHG